MLLHRRPGLILAVTLGGALGAGMRLALGDVLTLWFGGAALATVVVNLLGAFGLGVLLQALVQVGQEGPGRRLMRLVLGTGFFGGFTTYSGFALDTITLLGWSPSLAVSSASGFGSAAPLVAAGLYLAVSLVGGLVLAFVGVWLGAKVGRQMVQSREGRP
ncbi:fluoride efflux transporter FluC [Kocuria sp.]|uniref:fluoride efflux transporter FluC n=1 Tax=Kocuria sp. TaxID=1871328 RepID=UPI0026E0264B|nr:CrcB family protein [Kocuria sp.]MDO5618148.1 CrcB family protein [Kocuria sp.]